MSGRLIVLGVREKMSEERRSAGPGSGDSLAAPIIATVVVTTVLAALAVVARFYTRVRILHVFAVEDWMILIALVMSCGTAACFIVRTCAGCLLASERTAPGQVTID